MGLYKFREKIGYCKEKNDIVTETNTIGLIRTLQRLSLVKCLFVDRY